MKWDKIIDKMGVVTDILTRELIINENVESKIELAIFHYVENAVGSKISDTIYFSKSEE